MIDPIFIIDDRVVVLSDASRRAVASVMRDLDLDLQSAVRLAADMQDDAPDDNA